MIRFSHRNNGPERLLAEAEIVFTDGLLAGCKLVGFCVWRGADDVARVTVPSRSYGLGGERRYFDLLRSNTPDNAIPVANVKAAILNAFAEWNDEPERSEPSLELANDHHS